MRLIVITPSKDKDGEIALATKMFECGLMTLHIRKPKYSTSQLSDYIKEIPSIYHNRIVIHSHHKLALKYDLKGIHLTSVHLVKKWKYWFVRQRLKLKFHSTSKSRSYSRLQYVYTKEEYNFNYYLVGTMYNSITGGFYSGYYEDGVIAAIKNSNKNLVARGGTTASSVKKTFDYGFYGIAFNSYIWESQTPFENFMKVIEAFKSNNIEIK